MFGYNYVSLEERDFQVDRITYQILEVALRQAHDFCKLHRPLLPFKELISGNVNLEKYRDRSMYAHCSVRIYISICLVIGIVADVLWRHST